MTANNNVTRPGSRPDRADGDWSGGEPVADIDNWLRGVCVKPPSHVTFGADSFRAFATEAGWTAEEIDEFFERLALLPEGETMDLIPDRT